MLLKTGVTIHERSRLLQQLSI